jgi:hypothetical protein
MKIDYSPHPSQQIIHDALKNICSGVVVMCIAGRRFGKTVLAVNEIVRRAIEIPNARIWYVAPTKDQAYRIAWRLMLKYLPKHMVLRKREDRHTIELVNGSLIEFLGLQDQVFLLGAGLHFVALDEFPTIPWTAWIDVIKPMLLDYNGDALFIGSVPDPKIHAITKEFLEMYENGLAATAMGKVKTTFNFPSRDNPHNSEEKLKNDIDDLMRMGREKDVKRIYEGAYTREFGLVFPGFNYDQHTCDPFKVPGNWMRVMAVDPHPQKPIYGLWCAIDPNHELWFYREEKFEDQSMSPLTVPESAAKQRQLEKGESIRLRLIDPTFAKVEAKVMNTKSVVQQYSSLGLYFREGNRDFMTFFEEFTDRLRALPHPTLHVMRSCPGLIRQIQGYMWDSWAGARAREDKGVKDRPKAVNDDFVSCMKYIINARVPFINPDEVKAQVAARLNARWQRFREAQA